MRKILVLLLLIVAVWPQCAFARGNANFLTNPLNVPPSSVCPFGTVGAADNGCSGSIAGAVGSTAIRQTNGRQVGGWIDQMAGLSTDYTAVGPAINLPAIDYYTGNPLALSTLVDPTTSPPTGCTYNATGSGGGAGLLTCNVATTGDVIGYDFRAINAHGCTALLFNGTGIGTVHHVWKNDFKNDGNCVTDTAAPVLVRSSVASEAFDVEYNTFDGNGLVWETANGSCSMSGTLTCSAVEAFLFSGAATFKYNSFINFTQRPYQYQSKDPALLWTMQYNLEQGCCSRNPQAHGEFVEYAGGPGSGQGYIFQSNTVIQTTAHHDSGLATFPAQFVTLNPMPIVTVDSNFIVPGLAGGQTGGTGATNSTTFSGSVTGNTFTTSGPTAGVMGSGALLVCGPSGNQLIAALVYTGSTGTTSSGIGGGGFAAGASTWPLDLNSATITAGIDNGSGGAGNTFTVTTDNTFSLQIGSIVTLSGTRHITAMSPTGGLTGTGGTGTYTVDGSAVLVSNTSGVGVNAPNALVYAGGWTVPGTIACASKTYFGFPFTTAVGDQGFTEPFGQITNTNNYVDMSAFAGTSGFNMWAMREGASSFTGTISGTTLTVSGLTGTPIVANQLITTTSGVSAGTFIVSGSGTTWTVSNSQSIGPVTMHVTQSWCSNATIWGGNVDMAGVIANPNVFANPIAGNGC